MGSPTSKASGKQKKQGEGSPKKKDKKSPEKQRKDPASPGKGTAEASGGTREPSDKAAGASGKDTTKEGTKKGQESTSGESRKPAAKPKSTGLEDMGDQSTETEEEEKGKASEKKAAAPSRQSKSSQGEERASEEDERVDVYRYQDFSHVQPDPTPPGVRRSNIDASPSAGPTAIRVQKLPAKLNAMLSNPDFQYIISWMPHGRSWKVHHPHAFVEQVIPLYFEYTNYNSFIRLVNAWGFRRLTKGSDRGSYFHELFLRGMPHLHAKMHRLKSTEKKMTLEPEDEPDLYKISDENPLPPTVPDRHTGIIGKNLSLMNRMRAATTRQGPPPSMAALSYPYPRAGMIGPGPPGSMLAGPPGMTDSHGMDYSPARMPPLRMGAPPGYPPEAAAGMDYPGGGDMPPYGSGLTSLQHRQQAEMMITQRRQEMEIQLEQLRAQERRLYMSGSAPGMGPPGAAGLGPPGAYPPPGRAPPMGDMPYSGPEVMEARRRAAAAAAASGEAGPPMTTEDLLMARMGGGPPAGHRSAENAALVASLHNEPSRRRAPRPRGDASAEGSGDNSASGENSAEEAYAPSPSPSEPKGRAKKRPKRSH